MTPNRFTGQVKAFDMQGMLCPFTSATMPVLFYQQGSKQGYVWAFESPEALRAMCAKMGVHQYTIKQIADWQTFRSDVEAAKLRVAVNPRFRPDGKTVWNEIIDGANN